MGILILLVGVGLVFGVITLYPQILPIIEWAIPGVFVLWGGSRFYLFGKENHLTYAAGCLLILGGFTYASYLIIPMSELAGAFAQLILAIGIFVELFAAHYRNQD